MSSYDRLPVEGLTFTDWMKVFVIVCGTGLLAGYVLWLGGLL